MTADDALERALADLPDPSQIQAFRRLSPGERLMAAERLYQMTREVKAAALRAEHPEWDEAAVEGAVSRAILLART